MILVEKPVRNIKIRVRGRKDAGNLQELADSIKLHGLLQPIVLSEDGFLIAGQRRLMAHELAGIDLIQCRVVQPKDLLAAFDMECAENTCRKDFTPTEMVEIGRMRESMLAAAWAKEKVKPARGGVKPDRETTNIPVVSEEGEDEELPKAKPFSKAAKAAAASVGTTPQTYAAAKEVTDAAKAEPEKFGDLPAKMDAEGVAPAKRELDARRTTTKKDRLPDAAGVEVPALLRDLFGDPWFGECDTALSEIIRVSQRVAMLIAGKGMAFKWLQGQGGQAGRLHACIGSMQTVVKFADECRVLLGEGKPAYVCETCDGKGDVDGPDDDPVNCTDCRGTGYLPAWRHKELYEDVL